MKKFTVWTIAIPVFIEFLLTFSVFFTDTFFLSRVSDTAAASVGSIIPVFMIFVLLFMMMAQGGCAVAAQFLGGSKQNKAEAVYEATFAINAGLGMIVAFIFCFISTKVGYFLGMNEQGSDYVATYLYYLSPSMLLIGIKTAYNSVFSSQGKTSWNMFTAILVNIANISFNLIFVMGIIGGLSLGVKGVALATIISQIIAVIFQYFLVNYKFKLRYFMPGFKNKFRSVYKSILSISIPASIEPISAELGMMVLSVFAIALGEHAMAARAYVMNLLTIAICWSASMAIANQVLISHSIGAKEFKNAHSILKNNLKRGVAGSLFIALILYVFAKPLIGIFTTDPSTVQIGISMLLLGFIIEPARAVCMMTSYALKGAGDAKFPTMVGVICTWCIAVPVAYSLGFVCHYGFIGIWVGLFLDEIFRATINYWRWKSDKWQVMGVMMDVESITE